MWRQPLPWQAGHHRAGQVALIMHLFPNCQRECCAIVAPVEGPPSGKGGPENLRFKDKGGWP